MLAVIEHQLEAPVVGQRCRIFGCEIRIIRRAIAVLDAREVTIGRPALGGAVALVGRPGRYAVIILRRIAERGDIPLVVVDLAGAQLKIREGSAGSAMRLSLVLPYQVVTLSLVIDRQNMSVGSAMLVKRSMRADAFSTRGRKRRTRYCLP